MHIVYSISKPPQLSSSKFSPLRFHSLCLFGPVLHSFRSSLFEYIFVSISAMDDSEKADLEVKGFSLVDISRENDSRISASSSSGFLIDLQSLEHLNDRRSPVLLEAVDAVEAEDTVDNLGQREQLPQQSEPLEPERTRKNGKCNLRKSLAWDSAFFTSAGVLDPEELSSMIDGVEKSGRNLLPGIEEDTRRSTDSISTLESESLTLDVLEADLFEDIRASIQKSSRASNVASSNSKSASQETEYQALHSSKKLALPSPNMMKAKSASKKHPIVIKEQGRLIKQGSGCPQVTQMKPVLRNGDSSSSLAKPPKLIGRANPISVVPTKRASLGTSRVKMENDNVKGNTVANKGTLASKIPGLGVSRRVLPKPALSSKSSYMGSSTVTKTEATRSSSCDSSASASSDNIGRSPLNVRRKTDSRTVNPHSSGSILKTPSTIPLKSKTPSGKSGFSAHLMSSKFSSSISPASSISDWSSESSSSVSTVNQRSNKLRISLDSSSSCRSVESDIPLLDLQKHSNDQISDGGENQVMGSISQNIKKATAQIGSHAAPTKPSGLRMPSPKIGFFDGVKSLVRAPNGGMQSHSGLSTGLPKVGSGICSPSGDSSKPKLGKLQSAAVSAIGVSNALTRISSAASGVKNSPKISPKVLNKTSRESGSSIKEVGTKGTEAHKHVPDPGLDAEKNGSISGLKDKQSSEMQLQGNADLKDIKITSIEQDICDSTSVCNIENINSSQKVGEDANYGQHHLKDNFHLLIDNIENEKTYFEDQVGGLNKCVGALDQKLEIQKVHIGEFISQVDVCSQDSGAFDLSCFGQLIVHDQKEGTNLSNPSLLSVSPTILEVTAGTRTPFAVKNSFYNSEGLIFSTGLSLDAVDKTATLPSSEMAQKENS